MSFSVGWPSDTCSGVHTGPCATALTRMPRGARSCASALVKPLMGNVVDASLMIVEPGPRWGSASLVIQHA